MAVLVSYASIGGATAEIAHCFGGRLGVRVRGWLGLLAERMASGGQEGDLRNPRRVREWARGIAAEIRFADHDPPAGHGTIRQRGDLESGNAGC